MLESALRTCIVAVARASAGFKLIVRSPRATPPRSSPARRHGKELVARAIYSHSQRSTQPFLASTAPHPEQLLESELFHERARHRRTCNASASFEQCNKGTFSSMKSRHDAAHADKNFARAAKRTFERVGGNQPIQPTARHRRDHKPLEAAVAASSSRDLFTGSTSCASTSAVARRRDDIPLLGELFSEEISREQQQPPKSIAAASSRRSKKSLAGNVRELENAIRRASSWPRATRFAGRFAPEIPDKVAARPPFRPRWSCCNAAATDAASLARQLFQWPARSEIKNHSRGRTQLVIQALKETRQPVPPQSSTHAAHAAQTH